MPTIRKILFLLTSRERRRGALVLCMVIVMALLETAGVASVMPFLSVLGNPEVVHNNQILSFLYQGLGFESVDTFLMALGAAASVVIVFSAVFCTLTHYAMNRFIQLRRHSIGERLLETYLRQPYSFFLDRHSGDLAKTSSIENCGVSLMILDGCRSSLGSDPDGPKRRELSTNLHE